MNGEEIRSRAAEYTSSLRNNLRAQAIAIGLSVAALAGCTVSQGNTESTTTPDSFEAVEPTTPSYPECASSTDTTIRGEFIEPEAHASPSYGSSILDFLEANEQLTPQELVDAFLAENQHRLNGNHFKLVFDEGQIPDDWMKNKEETTGTSVDPDNDPLLVEFENQILIGKVDNLIHVISEYPGNTFDMLGIETIRIGDRHLSNSVGGHFSVDESEIHIEFDTFGNGDNLSTLRGILAHELMGHAAHAAYCRGNYLADEEISRLNGNFEYISEPGLVVDAAEYEKLPEEYFAYGPNRLFPREYGAHSVAEDFATIVEFTLEQRGLIREGDADFDSPLHHKQQIIMLRLETIMPGFAAFAEKRTNFLRKLPTNEVFAISKRALTAIPEDIAAEHGIDDPKMIISTYNLADSSEIFVVNGAIYDETFRDNKSRGGELRYFPRITFNTAGDIIHWDANCSCPVQENEQLMFLQGKSMTGKGDILRMTVAEWKALKKGNYSGYDEETGMSTSGIENPIHDEFFADDPQLVIYNEQN
jgi:hypothetical protein